MFHLSYIKQYDSYFKTIQALMVNSTSPCNISSNNNMKKHHPSPIVYLLLPLKERNLQRQQNKQEQSDKSMNIFT
jgi:hypothetical protein